MFLNVVSGTNNDIVIITFREHHQQSVVKAILSIMTLILKEKVSQPLLDVILQNLLKEGKVNTYWNVLILFSFRLNGNMVNYLCDLKLRTNDFKIFSLAWFRENIVV